MTHSSFKRIVWKFYKEHGRTRLPWRLTRDPYKILVSEIMLQQTQVERVIPFYLEFTKRFPNVRTLAKAKTKDVLKLWQGLGYNRRAVNLKRAAETIVKDFSGKFPSSYKELVELPGIGPATAGDLLAFVWDKPAVVIETNIRTVFIHHFFPASPRLRRTSSETQKISDKQIFTLVEKTLPKDNCREWYYALMDYGSHLKRSSVQSRTLHRKSAHYKKQSAFKGSNRELRSNILKLILKKPRTKTEIIKLLDSPAPAVSTNLLALTKEGLINVNKNKHNPKGIIRYFT